MTNNPQPNALALIPQGLDEGTALAVQKFIPLLKELIVGGKKFTDAQIVGRAVFAAQQGLDPITEVNTIIDENGNTLSHSMHINGYRRKCQEQVGHGVDITLSFRKMETIEFSFLAGKYGKPVLGYECILRDGQTYRAWQQRLIEVGRALREAMGQSVAYDDIIKTVGPAPVYDGVGLIYESEITGSRKDSNFNPIERCKKRAEVQARSKRFPRNAPIFADGEVYNGDTYVDATFEPAPTPAPQPGNGKPVEEILSELGYAPTDYVHTTHPGYPQPEPEEPPQIEPDPDITDILPDQRPYNLAQLIVALGQWAQNYAGVKADSKHRGMLANCLATSLNGSEDARHDFDLHVFGCVSLNDVPDEIVLAALKTWYGLSGWNGLPDPMAVKETRSIYAEISVSKDQPELTGMAGA